ncbi:transmembrane protein 65-like isoform X1 [Dysidea avara]|uniref:transmembrane protein 65-like isoform X1 n=1 Tax=Dysidea avara TaxID=196820 RepID=UPI003332F020
MIAVRSVCRWQLQLRAMHLLCNGRRTRITRRHDVLQQTARSYATYKFEYIPAEPMAFVAGLSDSDRQKLKECLQNYSSLNEAVEQVEEPSGSQKRLVMGQAALPFIGFGFFDNLIMISAGEYIDSTIGVALGISTMAAAAFGNTVSDVMGIGLSHFVERFCRKLGIPNPKLTPAQAKHSSVKWLALMGKCGGILLGCLIGMSPLLWFDSGSHRS